MSEVSDLMVEGLESSESATGTTFVWAGSEFPCTAGAESDGHRLDDGGFKPVRKLTIAVRKAVFPEGVGTPQKGQTIEFRRSPESDPIPYRIRSITDYYGAAMEFHCEDPNAWA